MATEFYYNQPQISVEEQIEEMELISLATQGCEEVQFCVKVDDNLARELMIRVAFYEQ